jgi:hypothetical protein
VAGEGADGEAGRGAVARERMGELSESWWRNWRRTEADVEDMAERQVVGLAKD